LAAHPKVRNFRQRGMIWAFEADSPRADFSRWCFAEALAREVLLRPIGRTVYFMPPYVTSDADWGLLVDATLAILNDA
jgi:adenosylmethionine-8-amino-7-oxononanoate aminotransferase